MWKKSWNVKCEYRPIWKCGSFDFLWRLALSQMIGFNGIWPNIKWSITQNHYQTELATEKALIWIQMILQKNNLETIQASISDCLRWVDNGALLCSQVLSRSGRLPEWKGIFHQFCIFFIILFNRVKRFLSSLFLATSLSSFSLLSFESCSSL